MKKNLLNRRKSRLLLNQNFGIYSNGKGLIKEFDISENSSLKNQDTNVSKSNPNSNRNSKPENKVEAKKDQKENVDFSQVPSINISKNEGNLQLGLYTIVEEDKSIVHKSRASLSGKKERKNSNKKNFMRNNSVSGGENTLTESDQDSISFHTSSLLKNINIKCDFPSNQLTLKKVESADYIESSIYNPLSSSEEEDERERRNKSYEQQIIKEEEEEEEKEEEELVYYHLILRKVSLTNIFKEPKIRKRVRLSVNSYNLPSSTNKIVPFNKDDDSKDSLLLASKKEDKNSFIKRRSSLQISGGDIVDSNKSKVMRNGNFN
jgi:hypothetical protein